MHLKQFCLYMYTSIMLFLAASICPPPPPYRGLFGLNHPPTLYPSGNLTSFVQHLEVGQKYFTAEILSHSSLFLKM